MIKLLKFSISLQHDVNLAADISVFIIIRIITELICTEVAWKVLATLLTYNDEEFESCQLCVYEKGLLDELVLPATIAKLLYSIKHCLS